MGYCVQRILDKPMANKLKERIETFIYVVGRRVDNDKYGGEWHIQGIASTPEIAESMCRDGLYFVGPLPLDISLPHDTVEWVGLYFPLKNIDQC